MRVLVARHGETDWNLERRYQGHAQSVLTNRGRRQAEDLAQALHVRAPHPCVIASSDLTRARTTADPYAGLAGSSVVLLPSLREIDTGEWTGRLIAEVALSDPEASSAVGRSQYARFGNGECLADLRRRTWSSMLTISDIEHDCRQRPCTAVVFTHGALIRALCAEVVGMPTEGPLRFGGPANCSVATVDLTPVGTGRLAGRLLGYNDPIGADPVPLASPHGRLDGPVPISEGDL